MPADSGDAAGVASSLVTATYLDPDTEPAEVGWRSRSATTLNRQRPEGWRFLLAPTAGEAGGSFHGVARSRSGLYVPAGEAADPERSAQEAARRARGRVRRMCAAYGLNRLGTLTYAGAGCFDIDAHLTNTARFWRQLRRELGVDAVPYVRVWEWHPGGHGLHEHFAIGRFIPWTLVRDVWGLGRVDMRLIGDLPIGSTVRQEARVAARYLAPYLSKGGEDRPMGRHRYEIAQGFPIPTEEIIGRSAEEVLAIASERMGAAPEHLWESRGSEDWPGPPSMWAAWR